LDLLDISEKTIALSVTGSGLDGPVEAFTDGRHVYFNDAAVARVGLQLSCCADLAGRPVQIKRSSHGWVEMRGTSERQLQTRRIDGQAVFRFDDEWLFTAANQPAQMIAQRTL